MKFLKRNKTKKIVFVGTNDHTFFLLKLLGNNFDKNNFSYFEIKKENDFLEEKKNIQLKKIKNLKNDKAFDYIVISSFEYQTTISEKIKKLFNSKKIFEIYDNSSRSLMDTYLIKNIKTNKKLFIQGPKTPVI